MKGDNRPPRILDQIIEMMFPLAKVGRFNFDARLLPVQSIDDTKYESSKDSDPDAAERKCRGRAASDDKACNRNLVWSDSCFAKKCDDSRFDRCVEISWQVKRSVLGGIENDTLSEAAVLLRGCRKTEWPHAPAHGNHVIIFRSRVDDTDLSV